MFRKPETEEEIQKDKERGRNEYMSNQTKTYVFRNRGLDIKMQAMEIMMKRLTELDASVDGQSIEHKTKTLAVMAEIGKAIIHD